jgi:hypothetical protein
MPLVPHVASGQIVASTWGNLVADHVVMRFTTAAQRTSQLTAPILGQLTTLDTAPGRVEYWTGTAWAILPTVWETTYNVVANLVIPANTTGTFDLPAVTVPFAGFATLDLTAAVFPNVASTVSQECQMGVVATPTFTAPTTTSYQKFSTHQTATVSQLWVQGRTVASWTALPAGNFQARIQFPALQAAGPAVNLQALFGTLRVTAR